MKRLISLFLVCAVCFFSGCGSKPQNTQEGMNENSTTTTDEFTQTTTFSETTDPTEAPFPEGMGTVTANKKSVYGKKTGTEKTYTGLEPLEEISVPVVDKDNLKKLSEKKRDEYYYEYIITFNYDGKEIERSRISDLLTRTQMKEAFQAKVKDANSFCFCLFREGDGYIYDYLGEFKFKISPMSFYQVNPVQTEIL